MTNDKDIDEHNIPQDDLGDLSLEEGVDEFSDESFDEESFDDGGEFSGEDWDSYEEEEDGGFDEDKAAKSKKFNNMVIGIAVLVALGVGGYKIMSAQQPAGTPATEAAAPTAQQTASFTTDGEAPPPAPYGVSFGKPIEELPEEIKEPPKGLINNPGALQQIRRGEFTGYDNEESEQTGNDTIDTTPQQPNMPRITQDLPPMPAPITTAGDITDNNQQEQRGNDDQVSGLIPMPSPSTPIDAITDDSMTDDALGTIYNERERTVDSGVSASATNDTMSPFDEPYEDTGTMTSNQSNNTSVALPADALAKLDKIETLIDRLDGIEARLGDINDQQDSIQKRLNAIEEKPSQPSRTSRPATTTKTTSKPSRTVAPAPKTAAPVWELKSAQPGQAMVSEKGKSDMVSIAVGDTLKGMGRITSISSQTGRWVVQGTQGRITQ